ncbi:MAG: hypothetical protein IT244_01275, partial [Bacteroidia bacterium]|nr:hypothetical protein [Bacteroidia bacterium]
MKKWKAFRANLDTTTKFITELRMNGQSVSSQRTCTDKWVARKLAQALKNGTSYIANCDGYAWEIGGPASCVVIGGCTQNTNEDIHFGCYPTGTSGVCQCGSGTYWIFRQTIGNSNWGGANTATCGPPTQWMELEFKAIPPFNYDVATLSVDPVSNCTYTQDITATFANLGKKTFDSFQYAVNINNTVYGPYWRKVTLAPTKTTTFKVYSAYTFNASTNYTINVYASKPNNTKDSFAGDDSVILKIPFKGTRPVPNAFDTSVCGSQIVTLRAVPGSLGDSLAWFSDKGANSMIGTGNKYTTKYLASGATYKFYVASYNGFTKANLNTGYGFTNAWTGTMFNLTATAGDILIDSLGINLYSTGAPPGQNTPLDIYMRQGGFNGVEQDATKWTKVWSGQVLSKGSQNRSTCYFQTSLKGGVLYGVYLNFTGGALQIPLLKGTAQTISNADLTLQGGTMNGLNFGTIQQNGTFEGEVFYRKLLCKSETDSAKLVINPSPYGAKLIPGTPFQTSPKKS